jgi:hypothetical protein
MRSAVGIPCLQAGEDVNAGWCIRAASIHLMALERPTSVS